MIKSMMLSWMLPLTSQWGEHIHLGYYSEKERSAGYVWKDFKKAKYDFIDEMLKFSTCTHPTSILDVGCGFGGTSRHLANMFPKASVRGEIV
jgi:MPBQ/MSBQ methyltransferase